MAHAPEILRLPDNGNAADLTQGSVLFIGTATVLLRYAGFTILTDPNFLHRGEHVRLGYGLRSTRRTNPALPIDALPPLDLIALSHLHDDHFDQVAIDRLDRSVPIITTVHGAKGLRGKGFQATRGLTTWQSVTVEKGEARVRLTAMPGKHGPGPLAALLPPVQGTMLEFSRREGSPLLRLYITGDTLMHDDLREIPRRYPEIDLALLHLGGTRVFGVMLTMDARQGVQAVQLVNPKRAIPIHMDDYPVFKSPPKAFRRAVQAAGLADRVQFLQRGETYTFHTPGG